MSSNWGSILNLLNEYLADFETRTIVVLENINELLSQSGEKIDDRIKGYLVKSVNSRLERTFEFFDIQSGSQVCKNAKSASKNDSHRKATEKSDHLESDASNEEAQICKNEIEIVSISSDDETTKKVETVSSSYSAPSKSEAQAEAEIEATEPMVYQRNIHRPSLDSNFSDQRSTCSPSTSNLPMLGPTLSPIDTPDSTPSSTPDINARDIKQEPDDSTCEAMTLNPTEANKCVVKMEDMPMEPMRMNRKNELPSTIDRFVPPIEPQPLKRKHSINDSTEAGKRQKTTEELRFVEPRLMFADNSYLFGCFHCLSGNNLFFEKFIEVYDHWECEHGALPFRFMAFGKAACFYCGEVDTFPRILDHHKRQHHSEVFIVVDRQDNTKCGLCHNIFSASEMVLHFKSQHDPLSYTDINSPICFSQSEIEQLLSLNSFKETDISQQIEAFICGYCNKKEKSAISFMQHFEQDPFQFMCSACSFWGNTIHEVIQHEVSKHKFPIDTSKYSKILMSRLERRFFRTKIIFTNGLVLHKHNTLNTTFDDRKEIWPIITRMKNQKLEEYTRDIDRSKSLLSQNVLREEELAKQRSYCSNLRIKGLGMATDADLPNLFLGICRTIGMSNVSMKDVDAIFRRSCAVVVQMFERNLKNKIISAWRETPKDVKSNLLKSVIQEPGKIFIESELTPFLVKLWTHAKAARDKCQIHSFLITDDGLRVKGLSSNRYKTAIIWSKDDLAEYIQGRF